MQAWLENSEAVCDQVGIERRVLDDSLRASPQKVGVAGGGAECGICCVSCDPDVEILCGHHFCRSCWKE